MEKGSYGYIDAHKRKQFIKTVLFFLAAILIFVLGLVLNKFSKQNIFTIIAVILVLPAAKTLVNFLVMLPYHTAGIELYNQASAMVSADMCMLSDMVISSPEKIMGLSFLVMAGPDLIGLAASEKEDIPYIETYLSRGVKNRGLSYNVKIYQTEEQFLQRLGAFTVVRENKEQKELKEYLLSLVL